MRMVCEGLYENGLCRGCMRMVCLRVVKQCVHYENGFCGLLCSFFIMIMVCVASKAVYMCIMVCREYKVVCAVRLISWSVFAV